MSVIVFTQADGRQAVIYPTPDSGMTLEQVALVSVPAGLGWEVAPDPPGAGYIRQGGQWVAAPAEPAILSRIQWAFFLDVTGFRAAAEAALAAMPKATFAERAAWAGMKAVIADSGYYRLPEALRMVELVRAMALPVTLPTDEEIALAWEAAAAFEGVASLG